MKLLAMLMMISMTACNIEVAGDDYPKESIGYYYFVPDSLKPEMRKWIIETVRAANPHSDEEPEDNIIQAERTALRIFGERKLGMEFYTDGTRVAIPYEKLNEWQKKAWRLDD